MSKQKSTYRQQVCLWQGNSGICRNGNYNCGKIPAQCNSFRHESQYEVCVYTSVQCRVNYWLF